MMFSFKAIITSRRYHVYKETSWSNEKLNDGVKVELETDAKSLSTDPYTCAIKARHSYFVGWKTVWHIPREISWYLYFLIKEENVKAFGTLKLLKYKASSILSGRLEVPLSLTFSCQEKRVVDTMEELIQNFYTFEYSRNQSNDTSDNKDKEKDDYQTIVLEPESEEDEGRKKSQSNKIDLEIDKNIPVPILIN